MNNLLSQAKVGEFGLVEFFLSVIFSLIIGIICMFAYRMYFKREVDRNESLAKAFMIMAPSITAIFWAIQYSLPLSLGLLGALSFVRFRTPIKKSEDISFILLVIALSLLSSIYRFLAASVLLIIIVSLIWARNNIRKKGRFLLEPGANLTLFLFTESRDPQSVNSGVKKALAGVIGDAKNYSLALKDIVPRGEGYSVRYSIHVKDFKDDIIAGIISALAAVKDVKKPEVFVDKALY